MDFFKGINGTVLDETWTSPGHWSLLIGDVDMRQPGPVARAMLCHSSALQVHCKCGKANAKSPALVWQHTAYPLRLTLSSCDHQTWTLDEEGLSPTLLQAHCSSPERSHQHQDLTLFSSHLPSLGHSTLLHPPLPWVALVLSTACLISSSSSSSFSPTQTRCLRDCTRASLASFGHGRGGKDSATGPSSSTGSPSN